MAHCSQPLLSRRVQHRFRCTSGPRHRRSAMRSMDRLQVQTSSGWMDIGNQLVTVTGGSGDAGTVLHMKGHTGVIRIMTTTAKAGKCTRDIGTMKTTTTATRETMIMIATVVITTTMTSDHYCTLPHPNRSFLGTVRNVALTRGQLRRRHVLTIPIAQKLGQWRKLAAALPDSRKRAKDNERSVER